MARPPENPTEDVIWDVVNELVKRFKERLKGRQVMAAWPGESIEAKSVWVSEITADSREVPGFVGETRVLVDEVYSVVWELEVHDEVTVEDTHAALSKMIGALDSTVREDPRLGEFPGLSSALFTTPFKRTVGLSTQGAQGYAQLNLEVRIRLY